MGLAQDRRRHPHPGRRQQLQRRHDGRWRDPAARSRREPGGGGRADGEQRPVRPQQQPPDRQLAFGHGRHDRSLHLQPDRRPERRYQLCRHDHRHRRRGPPHQGGHRQADPLRHEHLQRRHEPQRRHPQHLQGCQSGRRRQARHGGRDHPRCDRGRQLYPRHHGGGRSRVQHRRRPDHDPERVDLRRRHPGYHRGDRRRDAGADQYGEQLFRRYDGHREQHREHRRRWRSRRSGGRADPGRWLDRRDIGDHSHAELGARRHPGRGRRQRRCGRWNDGDALRRGLRGWRADEDRHRDADPWRHQPLHRRHERDRRHHLDLLGRQSGQWRDREAGRGHHPLLPHRRNLHPRRHRDRGSDLRYQRPHGDGERPDHRWRQPPRGRGGGDRRRHAGAGQCRQQLFLRHDGDRGEHRQRRCRRRSRRRRGRCHPRRCDDRRHARHHGQLRQRAHGDAGGRRRHGRCRRRCDDGPLGPDHGPGRADQGRHRHADPLGRQRLWRGNDGQRRHAARQHRQPAGRHHRQRQCDLRPVHRRQL